MKAKVFAWRRAAALSLRVFAASWIALAATTAARGMAPQRVLYIRSEFSDAPFAASDSVWEQRLMNIDTVAEEFWNFNSYGGITDFQSDYTEVFTLPNALTPGSPFASGADVGAIRTAMRNAAANANWNLGEYDQVVLSFPGLPQFPAGALGAPGTVWMPGANPDADGFTHEFGHALGVGHANAFEGGPQTYPGEHREGRDGLFMLGSDSGVAPVAGRPRRAPINLPMRHALGFVDDQLVHDVQQDGVIRLHAFDREGIDGDVALGRSLAAVFEHDGRDWWISFAPSLADRWAGFNGAGWADGVIVQEHVGAITRILDFTPASQGGIGNEEDFVDTRDGALRVGESFTFPESAVTLSALSTGISGDGAPWIDVRITDLFFAPDLPGDFDGNSVIDEEDFAILAQNLYTDVSGLTLSQSFARGDMNADLSIDFEDFAAFKAAFLAAPGGASGSPATIPEPASALLFAAAVIGLCSRARPTR